MARYHDFDSDYLIEMEACVQHYEVYSDGSSDRFRPTRGRSRGDENIIARVWRELSLAKG
jgi:hypothetical protein